MAMSQHTKWDKDKDSLLIKYAADPSKGRPDLGKILNISSGAIRNREKRLGIKWEPKDLSGESNPMYGKSRPDFKRNHWTKVGYDQSGKNNPNWKGGGFVSNGYRYVMVSKKTYIMEHRLVMSQNIGRELKDNEIVHHRDGNPLNNEIDNLELMTQSEHLSRHWKQNDIRPLEDE